MPRTYRLTVERTLVVELGDETPEPAARDRAALAMIEDLARRPLSPADVTVDAVPDAKAAGRAAPDLRLR